MIYAEKTRPLASGWCVLPYLLRNSLNCLCRVIPHIPMGANRVDFTAFQVVFLRTLMFISFRPWVRLLRRLAGDDLWISF